MGRNGSGSVDQGGRPANGELETTVDPHDAVAMLNGPILYRTSMQAGTSPTI